MKVKLEPEQESIFIPLNLTLTIQSQAEYDALYAIGNVNTASLRELLISSRAYKSFGNQDMAVLAQVTRSIYMALKM